MKKNTKKLRFVNVGKKTVEWIEKRGFYISLILCVGIICASMLFVTSNEIGKVIGLDQEENLTGLDERIFENEINSEHVESILTPLPKVIPNITQAPQESSKNPAIDIRKKDDDSKTVAAKLVPEDSLSLASSVKRETQKKTSKPKYAVDSNPVKTSEKKVEITFIKPVVGKLQVGHSTDKLVYSKTLNEWRVHLGIDIRAEKGTPVKAIANGTIIEVKDDSKLGANIVIEHEGKWKSIYANLSSIDVKIKGKKVKAGDVIGGVGDTASFESLEPPHLHLEMYKGSNPVNPQQFFDYDK